MAPISVTARLTAADSFQIDIEEDETVESLGAIIYSIHPHLGEDLRVAYKGRVLKPEQVLAHVGIKGGDTIAVAKAPARTVQSSKLQSDISAREQSLESEPSQPQSAACTSEVESSGADLPNPEELPPSKRRRIADEEISAIGDTVPTIPTLVSSVDETIKDRREPEPEMQADPEALEQLAVPPLKKRRVDEEAETVSDKGVSATPEASDASAKSDEPVAEKTVEGAIEVDLDSTAGLQALAAEVESGSLPSSQKLSAAMRGAASKITILENMVADFTQALQVVNMVSASSLRSVLSAAKGDADAHPAFQHKQEESASKSFLHKKGDTELQDLHSAANAERQMKRQTSGGVSGSGSCGSPTPAPLTKEEMDKARLARLAVLEAKQAEKKKEQEEAEERAKSREALFNRPFAGAPQTLGKS